MSDYMTMVEPLAPGSVGRESLRRGHAWTAGSDYVECGKQILGVGWFVHAVAWMTDPSNEYVRCAECIVVLERSRLPEGRARRLGSV